MEAMVERNNLRRALAQVRRNKGAPGVDGMTVDDLPLHLKDHWPSIRSQLLDGSYEPQPVRRVEIPKATGGVRAHRWSADHRSDSRSERGRKAAEGHPDGARPLHPAGGAAGAAGGLGPDVLGFELRLSAGPLRPSGGGPGTGLHRGRVRPFEAAAAASLLQADRIDALGIDGWLTLIWRNSSIGSITIS
jgi:hypothetical protein